MVADGRIVLLPSIQGSSLQESLWLPSASVHSLLMSAIYVLLVGILAPVPNEAFSMMGATDVFITAVRADQPEMHSCYSVRRSVFVEEQKVPVDIEMDDKDETATHILATLDGAAVGAARIVIVDADDGKIGKIGRVCVLPEYRGKGVGRKIVLFAVEELKRTVGSGGGKAVLGSQVHALKFYESMGFELIPGEEYMDAGSVPHRDMQMML